MEAAIPTTAEQAPELIEQKEEPKSEELTAKQLAAAEEENAARALRIINSQQEKVQAEMQEPVSIIGLAAQGREVLLEQLRQHADRTKPKEHIPPPRTERQMSQLEAELNAGRAAQQRHAEQVASRPVPVKDVSEGFTTPVHRPGNLVPDPTKPAIGGSVAGTRQFGTDAP